MKYTFSVYLDERGLSLNVYCKATYTVSGVEFTHDKKVRCYTIPHIPITKFINWIKYREIRAIAKTIKAQQDLYNKTIYERVINENKTITHTSCSDEQRPQV